MKNNSEALPPRLLHIDKRIIESSVAIIRILGSTVLLNQTMHTISGCNIDGTFVNNLAHFAKYLKSAIEI